jgi:hypothetical protein
VRQHPGSRDDLLHLPASGRGVAGPPHKDAGEPNQIDSTLPMLGKPFSPTSIENAVRELLDAPKR